MRINVGEEMAQACGIACFQHLAAIEVRVSPLAIDNAQVRHMLMASADATSSLLTQQGPRFYLPPTNGNRLEHRA